MVLLFPPPLCYVTSVLFSVPSVVWELVSMGNRRGENRRSEHTQMCQSVTWGRVKSERERVFLRAFSQSVSQALSAKEDWLLAAKSEDGVVFPVWVLANFSRAVRWSLKLSWLTKVAKKEAGVCIFFCRRVRWWMDKTSVVWEKQRRKC